jgi:hypothetical protein
MFTCFTGSKATLVRRGYSNHDTYGTGNLAFSATGALDAPDYSPQGSVRLHNTAVANPQMSLHNRDWDTGAMPVGACHDGPDRPDIWDGQLRTF